MIATQYDARAAVETLIRRGAKTEEIDATGQTSLHFAASGRISCCEVLLQNGAKINSQTKNGYTALMIAADYRGGDVYREYEAVRMLIRAGADTKLKDKFGQTALDRCQTKPECAQLIQEDEIELIDDLPQVETRKNSKCNNQ